MRALKGNGEHKALWQFKGVYCLEDEQSYVILPDGEKLPAKTRLNRYDKKYEGLHTFLAYPKMKQKLISSLTLINFDKELILGNDEFLLKGFWQNGRLIVQRDKNFCQKRPLPQLKFWFKNYQKIVGNNIFVEIRAIRAGRKLKIMNVKNLGN